MGLADGAKVQLYELPNLPSSLLGALGNLLGVRADAPASLADLPAVKQMLQGIPASVLVAPGVPQTRLPFDIVWQ
jgi:hypothetical protein